MTSSLAANLLMISCSGIGGGPGCGSAEMRLTSYFGGGACGPAFWAHADRVVDSVVNSSRPAIRAALQVSDFSGKYTSRISTFLDALGAGYVLSYMNHGLLFFGPFAPSVKICRLRVERMAQVSPAGASRTAVRYFVSGLVQGVGYRFFARRLAEQLQLTGFAKNLRDGRVEVYAIGSAESLEAFRDGLNRGPEGSMVSSVSEEDAAVDPRFAKMFSIER